LRWSTDDAVVTDDVTADYGPICDQGIVSFRDSEDNLAEKIVIGDVAPKDNVLLCNQEKQVQIPKDVSFSEKFSLDVSESKKDRNIDEKEEDQSAQKPEEVAFIVQDKATVLSPKSIDTDMKSKVKSIYDNELQEANYPSLKERSPTDEYISALESELSAGVSLAISEFDQDLEPLHAGLNNRK